MTVLPSILSVFCNEFDKFNNAGAGMIDFIYHMTLKLLKNHIFGLKSQEFATSCNIMDTNTYCYMTTIKNLF